MGTARRPLAAFLVASAMLGGSAVSAAAAEVTDATACAAEVEPNDAIGDATTFADVGCVSGTLVAADDVDIYRWQVDEAAAATRWTVELDGPADVALDVRMVTVDAGADGTDAAIGDELTRLQIDPAQSAAVDGTVASTGAEVEVQAGDYALIVEGDGAATESTAPPEYSLRLTPVESAEMASASPAEMVSASPAANTATGGSPDATAAAANLLVVAGAGTSPRLGQGAAVELVLDTSGSMLEKPGKKTKLKIAQASLVQLVDELPADLPVALRTFKAQPRSCATVLRVPLGPLDRESMDKTIRTLPIKKGTRTPIAKAIDKAAADLAEFDGHRVVVLLTDGKEDCGGDPATAIEALNADGSSAAVHIIGYDLPDDQATHDALAEWAALGNGRYIEAADRAGLIAALGQVLAAPYLVFDADGVLVAQGVVGDEGVAVEAGVYRVAVLTDPPRTFEDVKLGAAAETTLTLTP